VPLLPFVANETPLKEIYRVNQIFLISIKVLHTFANGLSFPRSTITGTLEEFRVLLRCSVFSKSNKIPAEANMSGA
jgi:hypothetical protein